MRKFLASGYQGLPFNLQVGLALVVLLFLFTAVGPLLSPYSPTDQVLARGNYPPSASHWFGTDSLGRDLLTRTMYGGRISLGVALTVVLLNLVIGVPYGTISGWYAGKVDTMMMGFLEILYSIPVLLYVIFFLVVWGPGLGGVLLALGLSYWLNLARQIRSQVLILKEGEFVLAARALGASPWHIFRRHIFPNLVAPLVVTVTFHIPQAVFLEALLGYLGVGVAAPAASWGVLLADGASAVRSYPWQLFFPAAFLCLTLLGFTLLGEGLQEYMELEPGVPGEEARGPVTNRLSWK